MKKILILIMILVFSILACSSPTSVPSGGSGSSDSNNNSGSKPPVEVPETPKPEPEPQPPTDGGEKPEVPETPQPEPQPPTLEQKYKGLALRLARVGREDLIGKEIIFEHPVSGAKVKIEANGNVITKIGAGHIWETYNTRYNNSVFHHELVSEKRGSVYEKNNLEAHNDALTTVLIVGSDVPLVEAGVGDCRRLFELVFTPTEIKFRKSYYKTGSFRADGSDQMENVEQAIANISK